VDPRLPVQQKVIGVVPLTGPPVAFPVAADRDALEAGREIEFDELIVRYTDGFRVFGPDGVELPTHEAFWFAWSQFHPTTLLWIPVQAR
jgi:hypothetical protein